MEKSFVMRIGNLDGNIDNNIKRLGFTFVDKINLLGFTLQNYRDMTATNFEKINMKIDNLTVGAVYITNAKSITNDRFAVFFPM